MAVTVVSTPDVMGLVKTPMPIVMTSDEITVDYIRVEVLVEMVFGSGVYVFAFASEIKKGLTDQFMLRVEERLKAYVRFALPDVNDGDVQVMDGPVRRWKFRYADRRKTVGVYDYDQTYMMNVHHGKEVGTAPLYYAFIDLPTVISLLYLSPRPVLVILDTDDLAKASSVVLSPAVPVFLEPFWSPDTIELKGNKYHLTFASIPENLEYARIYLPADVTASFYANTLVYTESTVHYAWLAGGSKKRIDRPLPAPSDLIYVSSTVTTIDVSVTSNSGGVESGFEWQASLYSDFSIIAATGDTSTGVVTFEFAGLTHGTLYYIRVRAVGSSFSSAWSDTLSAETASIFTNIDAMFATVQLISTAANANTNKAIRIRRSSDNATTDVYWKGAYGTGIDLTNTVEAGGSLGDWVGANSAYIVTIYYQSATNYVSNINLAQSTSSLQMKVINAGALLTKNGHLYFESNDSGGNKKTAGGYITDSMIGTVDFGLITIAHNDIPAATASQERFGVFYENNNKVLGRNTGLPSYLKIGFDDVSGQQVDMSVQRDTSDSVIMTMVRKQAAGTTSIYDNGQDGEIDIATSYGILTGVKLNTIGYSLTNYGLTGGVQAILVLQSAELVNRVDLETEIASIFGLTYPN